MRHSGHVLHEYAIVLALITVLCLGALYLLGSNTSTLLSNIGQRSEINDLFALIDVLLTSKGKQGVAANQASPANITLSVTPDSGQITLTDSGNGGVQNTSSLDGSQIVTTLAHNLEQLTDFKTADGKPLPEDIQGLLRKLAASGEQLGSFYQQYEANQDALTSLNQQIAQQQSKGQYGGEPYYDRAFVQQAIQYTEQYMAFAETYKQLSTKLAQNPAYSKLKTQLADYAGGISNLSHQNVGVPVFSQFHVSHINPQDLETAFAANPNTATQFKLLDSISSQQPPVEKEKTFQSSIVALGQSLTVGTPVTSDQPLSLTPPVLAASP